MFRFELHVSLEKREIRENLLRFYCFSSFSHLACILACIHAIQSNTHLICIHNTE